MASDGSLFSATAFAGLSFGSALMIAVGLALLYLAIKRDHQPLLLIPLAFGMILGNIPFSHAGAGEGVVRYLYYGIDYGIYPALIFLGLGVMVNLSLLISYPALILLGAAAQAGIFVALILGIRWGLAPADAGSAAIASSADAPLAVFLSSDLSPAMVAPVALAVLIFLGLIPAVQPPIMRALTSRNERLIRMAAAEEAGRAERLILPVAGFIIGALLVPRASLLLGMFFLGNLLRESGVAERLANTVRTDLLNGALMLLGLTVGAAATADVILTVAFLKLLLLGLIAIAVGTACGVVAAKVMNLFSKHGVNPMLGGAGLPAVPLCARLAQKVAAREDASNYLLNQANCANTAGIIGAILTAGLLLSTL